jgi:hypothetical protein
MKRGEHERFPQIIGYFRTTGSKLPSHCAMIGLFCRINQLTGYKFIHLAHDRCANDPIMQVS